MAKKKTLTIAIPMAGYGSRLRPHTWSKPKPLLPIAGKTVIDYLLDQFSSLPKDLDLEYVFIIGPNGWTIRDYLQEHYPKLKAHFVVQEEMKGQSHALYLAKEHFHGPLLMTFSDTLIETDLSNLMEETNDGIAWVKAVPDPRRFGAARTDRNGKIIKLIEKPQDMKDNLVMVGFYYFRSGKALVEAIESQMERNISLKNEYFLADAINIMIEQGADMRVQPIETWLDAGVPETVLSTNRYLLENRVKPIDAKRYPGAVIIPPVAIAKDVKIEHSVVGPYVSIAAGCEVHDCILSNCVIDSGTKLEKKILENSLLGRNIHIKGYSEQWNLGDNSSADQ